MAANSNGDYWSNPFLQLSVGVLFIIFSWLGIQNGFSDVYVGAFLIIGVVLTVGAFMRLRGGKKSKRSKGSRRR